MPLKISDTMVPTMDDINDLGDPGRRWQDLYMSGTLQGNNIKVLGDLTVKNAVFTGDVDFTDATVVGLGGTGADLLTSENTWTEKNTFEDIFIDNATYNSAQTRYWSVSPMTFTPDNETHDYTRTSGYLTTNTTGSSYNSSIHLPNGSNIVALSFSYYDNTNPGDVALYLWRIPNDLSGTLTADLMSSFNSSATSDDGNWHVASMTVNNSQIDNNNYNYFVSTQFLNGNGANLRSGPIEIQYNVDTPLP